MVVLPTLRKSDSISNSIYEGFQIWPKTPSHGRALILNFNNRAFVPGGFSDKLRQCGWNKVQVIRPDAREIGVEPGGEIHLEADDLTEVIEQMLDSIYKTPLKFSEPEQNALQNDATVFVIAPAFRSLALELEHYLNDLYKGDFFHLHITKINGSYEVGRVSCPRITQQDARDYTRKLRLNR